MLALGTPALLGAKGGCGGDYVSLGSEAGEAGESSRAGSDSGGAPSGSAGEPNAGKPSYGGGPSGGAPASGGAPDSGGAPASGGAPDSGGAPASGGGAGASGGGSGGGGACGVVPKGPISKAECEELGAIAQDDFLGTTCWYGMPPLARIAPPESGLCCRAVVEIMTDACEAQNGDAIWDIGDGATFRYGCPAGRRFLGAIPIGIEGGICCERLPSVSEAECAAREGEPLSDFMSNPDLYRYGCPGGRRTLGTVPFEEGGLCCEVPKLITLAECTAQCGGAIGDPGNGSSRRDGCPDRRRWLGNLGAEIGDEGGICCSLP